MRDGGGRGREGRGEMGMRRKGRGREACLIFGHVNRDHSVACYWVILFSFSVFLSLKGAQADLLAAGVLQHLLGAEPQGYIKWGSNTCARYVAHTCMHQYNACMVLFHFCFVQSG